MIADWERYGIPEERAESFAVMDDALAAAMRLATGAATRTRGAVADKNSARAAVEEEARSISAFVKARLPGGTVSVADVIALGFNPAKRGGHHAALQPPKLAPEVHVKILWGRTIEVRVADAEATHRRRPRGATAAIVEACVSETMPGESGDWFLGPQMVKLTKQITFDDRYAPGTRVWIRARWVTQRGGESPISTPAGIYLSGGGGPAMSKRLVA